MIMQKIAPSFSLQALTIIRLINKPKQQVRNGVGTISHTLFYVGNKMKRIEKRDLYLVEDRSLDVEMVVVVVVAVAVLVSS